MSTPARERLAAAVQRAGGRAEYRNGHGRLLIEGMDAAQVGEVAHAERVVVYELAPLGGSLEDVFFELVSQ